MSLHQLPLTILDGTYVICRFEASSPIPDWVPTTGFVSVTRTPDELSIVCLQDVVPEEVERSSPWRCLQVSGTLDFSMVGVLESLTAPLARANVSVFAISTFDTDYLLVQEQQLRTAIEALQSHGHVIT